MSRGPIAISLSDTEPKPKKQAPKKSSNSKTNSGKKTTEKPRKPRTLPVPKQEAFTRDPFDDTPFLNEEAQPTPPTHLPDMSRGIRWTKILLSCLLALASIGVSLWLTNLIETLFATHHYLGWAGMLLAGLAAISLIALVLKELFSIARLRKLEKIRNDAEQVLLGNQMAEKTIANVNDLYSARADLKWHMDELRNYEGEILDAPDRVKLCEKTLMTPLDQEAKSIISSAAKRVSVITALNPSAVLDILFVGFQVLQMLRKLMALYGGKPALFGTLKLARMTATHLAITGGLALSDTVLQQFLGKGLAGRLSTKLGEGTVNGIMTTRIGLSAIELCRPLPFAANEKPNLSSFLGEFMGVQKS